MQARWGRWGVAAAIAAALALSTAAPAQATTVGAIATASGVDAGSSASRAVVSWDGATETIDLQLGVDAAAGTIGLVLPTPSKPTVSAGDTSLFTLVDRAIAPVTRVEDDWWGRTAPAAPVAKVVPSTPLGGLEPTTIKATSRKGLDAWLTTSGLKLATADREQIADYASDGWSLSLIAVKATAGVTGRLDPVRLTFATKTPIVPLRLASTSKQASTLRLYVLGDHRVEFRQAGSATRNLNAAQTVVWSGPVATPSLATRGSYLTVADLRFDAPETQIVGDIGIVDAAADDSIIPSAVEYRPITLLGLPLGWVLVVWGGFGVIVVFTYLFNRFRAQ